MNEPRPQSEEKRIMPMSEIQAQIQRATETISRLNSFESWLETEAVRLECSPTGILEKYRKARYGT